MKNNGITEYYEEVETQEEYNGYFCSVRRNMRIFQGGLTQSRDAPVVGFV